MCPVRAVNRSLRVNRGGDLVVVLERACIKQSECQHGQCKQTLGMDDPVLNILDNRCASDMGSDGTSLH